MACNAIHEWSQKWRTKISVEKTVITVFSKSGNLSQMKVFLGNTQVKYEKLPKFLGITLDEKLTFSTHTDLICMRAQRRLNMLASMRGKSWGLGSSLIASTYKVLIGSIFDYSSIILLSIAPSNLNRLNIINNKAMRLATYWPPGHTASQMSKITGLYHPKIRAISLTVNYLNGILENNSLMANLFTDYIRAYEVNEGGILKSHRVARRTILGKIIALPYGILNSKKK